MLYTEYLASLTSCPFCDEKIVQTQSISSNESSSLLLSLAPYHKDHLLIVPHRHFEKIGDITPEEMSDILSLQKVGMDILKNLGYKNISILVREGHESGKSVEHLHYHIIPNVRLGDMDNDITERMILEPAEFEAALQNIKSVI